MSLLLGRWRLLSVIGKYALLRVLDPEFYVGGVIRFKVWVMA